MAVLPPEFQAPMAPGAAVQGGIDAFVTGRSLMERKQRLRMDQETQDQQRAEFQAKLPVLIAQRAANIASAHAAVTNASIIEGLRAKAAEVSGDYNSEFIKINQIPDANERSNSLASFQAKVAWMDTLDEYKGFVTTVNNTRASAALLNLTNLKLEEHANTAREATSARVDIAKQNNELRSQIDSEKTQRAKELADIKAQHDQELAGVKSKYQQQNTSNRVVTAGSYKSNTAMVDSGVNAKQAISQIDTALSILDDPEVRTGTGANFEVVAKRLGNALGADFTGVQKLEQLQTIMGQTVLQKARDLKGAISDKDVTFLDRVSPSLTKTPEGNRLILEALKKGLSNNVVIAQMISEMRQDGATEPEINNAVNDYSLNHSIWDNNQPSISPASQATGSSASPSPASGWTPEKQKRLDELKAKLGR